MFQHIRDPKDRLRAVVDAATADGERCFIQKETNVLRYIKSAEQMINNATWKKDNGADLEAFYLFVKFSTFVIFILWSRVVKYCFCFSLYFHKVKQHQSFKLISAPEQKTISKVLS